MGILSSPTDNIRPVFVLSTGRCGSTMLSNILNTHPQTLSLSELFALTGLAAFRHRRLSGERMWRFLSEQDAALRFQLQWEFEETLYPFGHPGARFTRTNVPPIMCATLPHLTDRHEALYDELEPVARGFPKQPPADHYRQLFAWLCQRFNRKVWIERSGPSLLWAYTILRQFPEARVIHLYRDGRDTAISMSRHHAFRMAVASLRAFPIHLLKLIGHDRSWEKLMLWQSVLYRFAPLRRLPVDKLELADFGVFWNGLVEHGARLFDRLPSESVLNVRFEDILAQPESEIRRIIRFISPELEDDHWIREASSIPRPTPSRFAQLAPSEQAALTYACRPGLDRLGYSI